MKYHFLALFIFFYFSNTYSQNGFLFKTNQNSITIPFQFINNLIIIPIEVNGVKLNFMVDTGVEDTILFSLDETNSIDFNNLEKVKIRGFGSNDAFDGYKTKQNLMKIKNYMDINHSIYLILDQDINFSSHVGIPVNGIIGNKLFKNNRVKIDYIAKRIIIYKNLTKKINRIEKKYQSIPLEIIHGKPYINVNALFSSNNQPIQSKLLVDTGNTDALWFFKQNHKEIKIPSDYLSDFLGRGFSGEIYGKRARIPSFALMDYEFKNPIVSFPDSIATDVIDDIEDRLGSVGSEVLRRFTTIYDYQNLKMYIKKNNNFDDPFSYDMSGLEIHHHGLSWITETYESNPTASNNHFDGFGNKLTNNLKFKFELKPIYCIANVRKNSPAELAGLQKNDIIKKINRQNGYDFTLEKINNLLKSEEGKIIELEIERKGKILHFKFQLIKVI